MEWKEKIEQLAALLEKIPQPQNFEFEKGIYQPYFLLELRQANWEILPYAEYTRLDGQPGKEVKLSFQIVESQKVNISQDELNVLSYIYSFTNLDTRRLFSYGQPIGFLLEWLAESRLRVKDKSAKGAQPVTFYEETGNLSLGIFKEDGHYILKPAIVFSDQTRILKGRTEILTSNPLFILNDLNIYRVESNLPAFFWVNFFRLQQEVIIPQEQLSHFIDSFVPKILPALDWTSLEDHLKSYSLPFDGTVIYLRERAGQLKIEVSFKYRDIEFPAHPPVKKSLANQGNYLFVVIRDFEKEREIRRLLQKHGLFYIQHRWQIDPQFKILDWLRTEVPRLKKEGITFLGEERLHRYRLRRGTPRLTISVKSGIDWLDLNFAVELDGKPLYSQSWQEVLRGSKNYLRLSDGSQVYLDDKLLNKLARFFELLGKPQSRGKVRLSSAALPFVEELVNLADQKEVDGQFESLKQDYQKFRQIENVAPPAGFKGTLRDYQQAGYNWLLFLNKFRFGGILADDMGLGKTIQVIAVLQKLKETGRLNKPALVCVPLTVVFNWEQELQKFAPELKVMRYQGQRPEREKMALRFDEVDVVIISYGILLQDQPTLSGRVWSYLILDESQKIKNPDTKTYQAILTIEAENRLCLTGTPVENSMRDLWSQFNFLNPNLLGSLSEFEARFIRNEDGSPNVELLKKMIYPFILRRKKEDVLTELPGITEIIQLVEMTEAQQQTYQAALDHYRKSVFESVQTEGLAKSKIRILEALTQLRQIACHPLILDEQFNFMESGKVQLLEEMLEELLEEGHKVLVFSQFVRFLNILQQLFELREWKYEYLDGRTRNRQERIENFQNDENTRIFLISLKAGGLGLNLTAADYVIHLDPWWNPAVEQQATDRAHRLGQQKPVFVYKYIVKNSVEEKILKLQQQKQEMTRELITTEQGLIKNITREDLQLIFQP
ncbi:MAG: hypothetical protein Kow0037_27790 [Calditrichia bacterium]